jgi:hypothetical protein
VCRPSCCRLFTTVLNRITNGLLDRGHSKVRVGVLLHGWKFKGSRFKKEGKVIAGKTNRIYIKDVGIGTLKSDGKDDLHSLF